MFKVENEPSNNDRSLFAAGDSRAMENGFLLSTHTIFALEHNRVCDLIKRHLITQRRRRFIRDQWLYQTAKLIVMAQLQGITMNEFVPAMLGKEAVEPYSGYNPKVDPRISTFFSSFAYRWGHSAIPNTVNIQDRQGRSRKRVLTECFFNTKSFLFLGVDNFLHASMRASAADVDARIVEICRKGF